MPETVTHPTPDDYFAYRAAARRLRAVSGDALLAALDGIVLDHADQHVVALLAEMHSETVAAAISLIERCRAGAGRYTAGLSLHPYQVDISMQLLDASDEETWHPITALPDCDEGCRASGRGDCVVIVSTAYRSGREHVHVDALLTVRIPAGEQ